MNQNNNKKINNEILNDEILNNLYNNDTEDNIRDPDNIINERLVDNIDFNNNFHDYALEKALKLSMKEENKRIALEKKVQEIKNKKEEKIFMKKKKEEEKLKIKEEKKLNKEKEKQELLEKEIEKRKNIFNYDFFKVFSIFNLSMSNKNEKDFYLLMNEELDKYCNNKILKIKLSKEKYNILHKNVLKDFYETPLEKNKKPRITIEVYETLNKICFLSK